MVCWQAGQVGVNRPVYQCRRWNVLSARIEDTVRRAARASLNISCGACRLSRQRLCALFEKRWRRRRVELRWGLGLGEERRKMHFTNIYAHVLGYSRYTCGTCATVHSTTHNALAQAWAVLDVGHVCRQGEAHHDRERPTEVLYHAD